MQSDERNPARRKGDRDALPGPAPSPQLLGAGPRAARQLGVGARPAAGASIASARRQPGGPVEPSLDLHGPQASLRAMSTEWIASGPTGADAYTDIRYDKSAGEDRASRGS